MDFILKNQWVSKIHFVGGILYFLAVLGLNSGLTLLSKLNSIS
jgi:hypothetical protein